MSEEENGKSKGVLSGFDFSHLITGGSAAGIAVAGSFSLTQYKVDQLQLEIAQIQPILVQQTKVSERQDEVIKSLQEIRLRLDRFEQTQVELVRTGDMAKRNSERLDDVARRLDRNERRLDRQENKP